MRRRRNSGSRGTHFCPRARADCLVQLAGILSGEAPSPDQPAALERKAAMSRFSLRYPYLIIVACLIVCVVGLTSLARMPVDLFPPIRIPVVVVATFFNGMPPEQIETD